MKNKIIIFLLGLIALNLSAQDNNSLGVPNISVPATDGQVPKWDVATTQWLPSDIGTLFTAGNGISIVGNTITNTLPDQTIVLTGGGITSITGTYPNFTITSTEVDGSITNETITSFTSDGTNLIITEAGVNYTVPLADLGMQGLTAGTSNVSVADNGDGTWSVSVAPAQVVAGDNVTVANLGTTEVPIWEVTAAGSIDSTTVSNTATVTLTETNNNITADVNDGSITPVKLDRTYLETEVDGDVTNELQDLSLTGNTLGLTNSTPTVDLTPYLDNTDAQTLSLTGNDLSISNGNTVTLPTADGSETVIQTTNDIEVNGAGTTAAPYQLSINIIETVQGSTSTIANDNATSTPIGGWYIWETGAAPNNAYQPMIKI